MTQHTDAAQKGLEEYNPFADDKTAAPAAVEPAVSHRFLSKFYFQQKTFGGFELLLLYTNLDT